MRRLAMFACSFALAAAGYVWLLPRTLALPIAAIALIAAFVLGFFRMDACRRARLCAFGLAVGLLWCRGYERIKLEPLRALCGEEREITAELSDAPQETAYGDISVAACSTLRLAWQQANVSGTLSLAGTLDVLHVVVGRLAVETLGATVTGTLDLGTSGGTLDLSGFPAKSYRRQIVRLISAGAVAGGVGGWSGTGVEKGAVRLSLETDGLYAEFLPPGFYVIVR